MEGEWVSALVILVVLVYLSKGLLESRLGDDSLWWLLVVSFVIYLLKPF